MGSSTGVPYSAHATASPPPSTTSAAHRSMQRFFSSRLASAVAAVGVDVDTPAAAEDLVVAGDHGVEHRPGVGCPPPPTPSDNYDCHAAGKRLPSGVGIPATIWSHVVLTVEVSDDEGQAQ
ncbi:MAG: hypothetical protein WBG76_15105 [Ornithinimicrobium sp.]